ncbi:alcohol dehydrogenase catalytic domain-containing protein [Streptomyces sp. NPDC001307]|uniref:alcohol dehydrogenase catalytic domain-containing protein n=1 Tax=Streptomyces sp. NPDC001307 TaxID=3364560 RepID=UPI00369EA56F
MNARRVAYTAARTLTVERAETAPPPDGHVRIDVAYTGICGTDLHVYHGAMDERVNPPGVLGQEMSGRIGQVGAHVTEWQAGDAVTVMPLASCGQCPACRAGHTHNCRRLVFLGIDAVGSMPTSWTVQADTVVRLPHSMRLDHATLVEPTAVAVHDSSPA